MKGIAGRVAVVAGAATGIGAATAARLAEEGAKVVLGDINTDGAERNAAELRAEGREAVAVEFDIADDASVANLMNTTVDTYGGLDMVHVNAADTRIVMRDTDIVDVELEVWDRTMAVDLRGHFLVARHAIPVLLKQNRGALVFTTSGAAYVGDPERPAYSAAKAGVNTLVRHIASKWGRDGLRANGVAPGLVLSESARTNMPQEFLDHALRVTRSPRLGEPSDIAAMVAYLMSDDAEWINGQILSVDGGATLR